MRLCLPARMGGGGKAESLPWSGPAGEARHTGVTILLWEREGKALGVPTNQETEAAASLSRSAAQATAPLRGATQASEVAASRAKTRLLRHQRSTDSRSESAAAARWTRREARAPAGQPKDTAPSRSEAGKSATAKKSRSLLHAPDHYPKGQILRCVCGSIAALMPAIRLTRYSIIVAVQL